MDHESQRKFLAMAYEEARKSKDPSTQNGALLVDAQGVIQTIDCNRFPDLVKETTARWERPLKYKIVVHAEEGSLFQAARKGIKTVGLTMVCPWAACTDCARAIIQCGITTLVTHKQAADKSSKLWLDDIEIAFTMLNEANVKIIIYDGLIGVRGILHSGIRWDP